MDEKICRSVWGMKVVGGLLCSLLPGGGGGVGGGGGGWGVVTSFKL